jgi:hypothetical protein
MSLHNLCSKDLKIIRLLFGAVLNFVTYISGPDGVVGIAACYGLDGRGINS